MMENTKELTKTTGMKMKDIATKNGIDPELIALESFNKRLNVPPPKTDIQENKDKSKYLPISFVQMTLDEMFFGLWETVNYREKLIANELVGSIELRVFHPVIKQWITKTGVAATPVRLKAGSKVMDAENKIYNALTQDAPHLLSDCIKNAAKQLGKRFGRDLNRSFEDSYSAMVTPIAETLLLLETVKEECEKCTTKEQLTAIYNANPGWQANQKAMNLFNEYKLKLSK